MKLAIKTNKTVDITDLIPKFVVFFDASLPITITRDVNNKISGWLDRSLNEFHATQTTSGNQPNYTSFNNNNFFGVSFPSLNSVSNGFLRFTIPAGRLPIDGTLYLATDKYVLQLSINIPGGSDQTLEITGGTANNLTGLVLVNGSLNNDEDAKLGAYFRAKGANFQILTSLNMDLCAEVTGSSLYTNPLVRQITEVNSLSSLNTTSLNNLSTAFRRLNRITSFPVIDTSNVTNINHAWFGSSSLLSFPALNLSNVTQATSTWLGCTSLVSFPALNLSKATQLGTAWNGCTNLTTFPAMDFRACVNFQETWRNCKLSQASVDEILISIAAGLANNPTKILAANGGSFTLTGTNFGPTTTNRRHNWANINPWEFNLSQVNESIGGTTYNFTNGISGADAKAWLAAKGWAIATN